MGERSKRFSVGISGAIFLSFYAEEYSEKYSPNREENACGWKITSHNQDFLISRLNCVHNGDMGVEKRFLIRGFLYKGNHEHQLNH